MAQLICQDCGASRRPGRKRCPECWRTWRRKNDNPNLERKRETKKARIAKIQAALPDTMTVCPGCESPKTVDGYKHCDLCRTRTRARASRPEVKARNKAKAMTRIHPVIDWMNEIKKVTPCPDCGKFKPPHQMHWDHLPGYEKIEQVSWFVHHGMKKEAITEMAKCELVCDSCHQKRGLARGQCKFYGHLLNK